MEHKSRSRTCELEPAGRSTCAQGQTRASPNDTAERNTSLIAHGLCESKPLSRQSPILDHTYPFLTASSIQSYAHDKSDQIILCSISHLHQSLQGGLDPVIHDIGRLRGCLRVGHEPLPARHLQPSRLRDRGPYNRYSWRSRSRSGENPNGANGNFASPPVAPGGVRHEDQRRCFTAVIADSPDKVVLSALKCPKAEKGLVQTDSWTRQPSFSASTREPAFFEYISL